MRIERADDRFFGTQLASEFAEPMAIDIGQGSLTVAPCAATRRPSSGPAAASAANIWSRSVSIVSWSITP